MTNILFVEDDKKILALCSRLLGSLEHDVAVHPALCAESAIEVLSSRQIDGAFIDIELPGMNGFALAERLRNSKQYHVLPIVFVTGVDKDIPETYKTFHNFDYINKPFSQEQFCSIADRFLSEIREGKFVRRLDFEKAVKLQLRNGTAMVKLNEIFFASVVRRRLCVTATSGIHEVSNMTLADFVQYVNDPLFAKCNKSCIVNVTKIREIRQFTRKTWQIYFVDDETAWCDLSAMYYSKVMALFNERVAAVTEAI